MKRFLAVIFLLAFTATMFGALGDGQGISVRATNGFANALSIASNAVVLVKGTPPFSEVPYLNIKDAEAAATENNRDFIQLGSGVFSVTNLVTKEGVGIVGQGDSTEIQNWSNLSDGPCIIARSNAWVKNFRITQMRNAESIFTAALGSAGQSGNPRFWNFYAENITATNGNTDGWYVRQDDSCNARLVNCKFISKWDAGAVFVGNHDFTYQDCWFEGTGGSQVTAGVVHGFNATGGTNTFQGGTLIGRNAASGGGTADTNSSALSIDATEGSPVVFISGSTLFSSKTNAGASYDIQNGFSGFPGTIYDGGNNYDATKVFGPVRTRYIPNAGGQFTTYNTNIIYPSGGGVTIDALVTFYLESANRYTNTAEYKIDRVATPTPHWEMLETFDSVVFTNANASPTNGPWYDVSDGSPTELALRFSAAVSNFYVIPPGALTVQGNVNLNGLSPSRRNVSANTTITTNDFTVVSITSSDTLWTLPLATSASNIFCLKNADAIGTVTITNADGVQIFNGSHGTGLSYTLNPKESVMVQAAPFGSPAWVWNVLSADRDSVYNATNATFAPGFTTYGPTWDGSLKVTTENDVYDKLESLPLIEEFADIQALTATPILTNRNSVIETPTLGWTNSDYVAAKAFFAANSAAANTISGSLSVTGAVHLVGTLTDAAAVQLNTTLVIGTNAAIFSTNQVQLNVPDKQAAVGVHTNGHFYANSGANIPGTLTNGTLRGAAGADFNITAPSGNSLQLNGAGGGTGKSIIYNGSKLFLGNGTINANVSPGGVIKTDITAVGNVGAGTDTLITYTVPANMLASDKDALEFDVWGTCAANTNPKQITVNYGGTTLIDGGAVVLNGVSWKAHGRIVRTGAATQTANCELTVGGTLLSAVNGTICLTTSPTETLSGTVVFKCTGTSTVSPNDNDIVQNGMTIKWTPGN